MPMSYLALINYIFITIFSSWNLSFEDDNIKGYTRQVDHSKYLEYKLEMTCEGTIQNTLELITNIKNYKTLYPYLSKAEILANKLPAEFDVLVVIDTPFPARDRIGVYSNVINHVSQEEIHISIKQKSELIPDTKYVNIVECYGSWLIKTIDDKHVSITHQFFADPGGSIPAWIINAFALKQPKKTFRILRKLLKQ